MRCFRKLKYFAEHMSSRASTCLFWGLSLLLIYCSFVLPWNKAHSAIPTMALFFGLGLMLLIFAISDVSRTRRLQFVTVGAIAVVLSYAFVYQDVGIELANGVTESSYWDALYFSLICFTTLGYGDLSPVENYRMLSALEALIGYIFLGLLIATTSDVMAAKSSTAIDESRE